MILRVESDCVDPFSLVSELQVLTQIVKRVSDIQICVEVDQAAEEILTGEEARELVTIAREALSNCICHARATQIVITLQRSGPRVQLRIRDNGLGFDTNRGPAKGIGFACMEDRAQKIGGRLEVQSTVGRGTSIIAHVYLEPMLTTI
jgi:signal transduction histidine kinase